MSYTIEEKKAFIKNYFQQVEAGEAFTIASVKKVAPSGMSRVIVFSGVILENGKPRQFNLTWYIAEILGYKIDKNIYGVRVSGCGMDMVFNTLYNLFQSVQNGYNNNYSKATRYESL